MLGHDLQSSLFNHPRIPAAIAEMTSLLELDVVAYKDVASFLLESTRSVLKTFRHRDIYDDQADGGSSGSLSINIAPQLTHALQEMELSVTLFAMASKSSVSLPAVRSVTLTEVLDPVQLEMLPAVFPNLDHSLIIDDKTGSLDSNRLVALREKNREAQKTCTWIALDRVVARPSILYALALACPIHHLTLDMMPGLDVDGHRASHHARARIILEDRTPTHLALTNLRLRDGGFSTLDRLNWIFPSGDARSGITHLSLDVDYTNFRTRPGFVERLEAESWETILDTLLTTLETLRLTHVRIVIKSSMYSGPPFSAAVHDGLRSFKFDRFVSSLASTIPSLTHIFITSIGFLHKGKETWETSRAWRVRRPLRRKYGGGEPRRAERRSCDRQGGVACHENNSLDEVPRQARPVYNLTCRGLRELWVYVPSNRKCGGGVGNTNLDQNRKSHSEPTHVVRARRRVCRVRLTSEASFKPVLRFPY
ncbi:hypothetical protein LXA43DRAFT_212411 [Ganoderma leucocontextum]|nr:hypothetical protein LXA43DRAFT_212411 [Ganoderma leucocontextum]